jgi:hypothetical protein
MPADPSSQPEQPQAPSNHEEMGIEEDIFIADGDFEVRCAVLPEGCPGLHELA